MGRVKLSREERFVQKYLKKHGQLKVLKIFNKELEEKHETEERESLKRGFGIPKTPARKKSDDKKRKNNNDGAKKKEAHPSNASDECKPVKLSFAILKAPERKKIELNSVKTNKKVLKIEKEDYESVDIPEDFKKIAKRFGLPEEHLDFFYEHRTSFNWEYKEKTHIQCTEIPCKFTTKLGQKCLVEHMISVHNYKKVPCGHVDCSYIAYSKKNLNIHNARFHGHGIRPSEFGTYSCPYPSCKNVFMRPSLLRRHINVHRNNVLSCSYCPYTVQDINVLHRHLSTHFNIRNYICDICSAAFNSTSNLNVHYRVVHSTDDFECQDCGFQARKLWLLQKHRSTCEKRLLHSRTL